MVCAVWATSAECELLQAGPSTLILCQLHSLYGISLQSGFCLYPVVIKYFLSQAKEKANPYVFTFYRSVNA